MRTLFLCICMLFVACEATEDETGQPTPAEDTVATGDVAVEVGSDDVTVPTEVAEVGGDDSVENDSDDARQTTEEVEEPESPGLPGDPTEFNKTEYEEGWTPDPVDPDDD